jgi:hypothetical protein
VFKYDDNRQRLPSADERFYIRIDLENTKNEVESILVLA